VQGAAHRGRAAVYLGGECGRPFAAAQRIDRPRGQHVAGWAGGQIGGAPIAAGQRRQLVGAGGVEQERGRQVAEQRHAGEHPSRFAQYQHRVEDVQAGAAVTIVDQQSGPARLDRRGPQVGQLTAVERRAGRLHRLGARERAPRGLAQEDLFV